ncbi:hypothetical protein CLK_3291 [Clostridium botulinum A3 str. Loch Maree]|nr:hypothetical protein CLK_3291 [Clostridium botulinum A3 str. Loch Maree]
MYRDLLNFEYIYKFKVILIIIRNFKKNLNIYVKNNIDKPHNKLVKYKVDLTFSIF